MRRSLWAAHVCTMQNLCGGKDNADMSDISRALLRRGVPVTLLDGSEATLLFDLEGIVQIEDDFGSLGGWQDALTEIREAQTKAKIAQPLLKMLRAGLMHDPRWRDAKFDPLLLEDYFRATMAAAEQAFPKDKAATIPDAAPQTTTDNFHGQTSITREPSGLDALTATSGA